MTTVMPLVGLIAVAHVGLTEFSQATDPHIPAWTRDFAIQTNDRTCNITDLKTGQNFTAEAGEHVQMSRGYSVVSGPSSCTVITPAKTSCQLRDYPIAPICG